MTKAVKIVVVAVVALLSFVAGVKYAEQVKSHASWMFESKDEEVALPDLSNEEIDGTNAGEQEVLTNQKAPQEAAPMDSVSAPEAAPAQK